MLLAHGITQTFIDTHGSTQIQSAMATPKFLQRMSNRTATPPSGHNRGASMTQSRSPGGIGFLSKQYQAVTSQNPGTPTRPPSGTPPVSRPPVGVGQLPSRMDPMPTEFAGSATPQTIQLYLQSHRTVLETRRSQPDAHIQWCDDYQTLLGETNNIASLLALASSQRGDSSSKVLELEAQLETVVANYKSVFSENAQLKVAMSAMKTAKKWQLKSRDKKFNNLTKEENQMISEIERLTGLIASINLENKSNVASLNAENKSNAASLNAEIERLKIENKSNIALVKAENKSNVASLNAETRRNQSLLETKIRTLSQQIVSSEQDVNNLTKEEKKMVLEIGRLTGLLASVTAENRTNVTLLKDANARSENLRSERNQARKEELLGVDAASTKVEYEKLAGRVAELEKDNAILLAEKSQWLNQLENENHQLQELFEDARSAKDIMVRELNAIDEERNRLAEDRERLEALIATSKIATSNKGIEQLKKQRRTAMVPAKAAPEVLTFKTFETMGQAKLKFFKLQERLRRRQEKMTTVFDAGSALIKYYRSIGDIDASESLLSSLVNKALHCDMAVVDDAASNSIDLHDGHDYTNSDPDVNKKWVRLDESLTAQKRIMNRGCKDMVTMFISAYNAVQQGNASDVTTQKYSSINEIYSELMSNSLETGGSPLDVAEDVEYELAVFDRVLKEMSSESKSTEINEMQAKHAALLLELNQNKAAQAKMAAKHELLLRNHKHLTQKARAAGI